MIFRRLAALAAVLAPLAGASAQSVVFSDGFENGLANWSATGLWHEMNVSSPCGALVAPFPEGQRCAHYGFDPACNYDTGSQANSGALTLVNPVQLPTGFHRLRLRAWMLHDVEPCSTFAVADLSEVQVSTNGGGAWTTIGRNCVAKFGSPDFWNPRALDLTPYAGQSVLVRFSFQTVDFLNNSTNGVFVDAVEIRGESGTTFCTSTCPCGGPFTLAALPEGGVSGCRNSTRGYAELAGSGATSVSADTLHLTAVGLPDDSRALLVQASAFGSGAFDGEGRACLSGPAVRLGVVAAPGGVAQFPAPTSAPLSVAGLLPGAGGTRHYQVRYRDNSLAFCGSSNVNWTNGYSIAWTP